MNIIGWIREGDKAACGGIVAEGSTSEIGYGKGYSFQGAKMACRKGCAIADGFQRSTLSNGRARVIHGMMTSGGCPLISTLNDIDGVGNEDGAQVAPAFIPDGQDDWKGASPPPQSHDERFDEYFVLVNKDGGPPACNRPYRLTLGTGEVIEGRTDDEGRTSYATSDQRVIVSIDVGPATEFQAD